LPQPTDASKQGVRFNERASAVFEQRGERNFVEPRGQVVEAMKAAQAYVSALNRQPPPPPPGGGSGCKENCCWRWLTAMLLKELQVLRRTVHEAREAFVEQERTFASLDAIPNEKDYEALIEQHRKTQQEHQDLSSEFPELKGKIIATREALNEQNEEIRLAEAEVAKLKEVLKGEEDKQHALQARLRASEREVERTRQATAELQAEFEETEKKKHRQEVLMDMVVNDKAILETQREMLQVGSRGARKKGGGVAGKTAAAPSAASSEASPKSPAKPAAKDKDKSNKK